MVTTVHNNNSYASGKLGHVIDKFIILLYVVGSWYNPPTPRDLLTHRATPSQYIHLYSP